MRSWCRKNIVNLQNFLSLKFCYFQLGSKKKQTDTYMLDTPNSLLFQVLTIPLSGSLIDQVIGLSEKLKTNSGERLCRDFVRVKSLPKRLLSVAMIVEFSFELITIFTVMCLNVDRLFFSRENKMISQRI